MAVTARFRSFKPDIGTWTTRFRDLPASARFGLTLFGVVAVLTLLAPVLTSHDPAAISEDVMWPPSFAHPMGTDDLGRDNLARVLYGGRVSLSVGLLSGLFAMLFGMTFGMLAGYVGGWFDDLLMRVAEMFQVIPRLIIACIVIALFGASFVNVVLVIGCMSWPPTARIIRSRVLALRDEEFIAAAIMSGASTSRVLLRHIFPNILPFFLVSASIQVGSAILSESFLSFLGLGDPARPSWGHLLQQGQLYMREAWWLMTFPGLALAFAIFGLNLMGDGFGCALNRGSRAR